MHISKIKLGNGLIPIDLLGILLIAVILFSPSNIARLILGVPIVLFFTGYALIAALFPKKELITVVERLALSFVFSIVVVPLIGLILNYTPWGLTLNSVLYSTVSFLFVMSIIAWFRRRSLPDKERLNIEFQLKVPILGINKLDRVLSITLVVVILAALGMLGYSIATPKIEQRFTEFYILGPEGKATDYPTELVVGETSEVVVGIVNQEYETMFYRLDIMINGIKSGGLTGIGLAPGERWEEAVKFMPEVAGEHQKLELLLYKNGEVQPLTEPLRLWLDVREE